MRRSTIICGILAVAAGAFSIVVKTEVQDLEDRLSGLHRDIAANHEALHVLRAEWSYLNQPQRLEALARHHLGLRAPWAAQTMRISDLPFAGRPGLMGPGPVPAQRQSPPPYLKVTGPDALSAGEAERR